jgi:ABC-type sulfate transport system permease component
MQWKGGRVSPMRWNRFKIRDPLPVLFVPLALLLLVFVVLPLLSTLVQTPLAALWQTLNDRQVLSALGITFYAAVWATVLALVTGVPLAYLLARYKFPLKTWVEGLVNLPIVIPHTAVGITLLMVFGRNGNGWQILWGIWCGIYGYGRRHRRGHAFCQPAFSRQRGAGSV